jgi:hypothetical protein
MSSITDEAERFINMSYLFVQSILILTKSIFFLKVYFYPLIYLFHAFPVKTCILLTEEKLNFNSD